MRFLGIDPGLLNLGYALIEKKGDQPRILDAGTLRTSSKEPLPERLYQLYRNLLELIKRSSPDVVIVEEPLSNVNPHSTAKVIQVYSAILIASLEAQIKILTFKPTEWKKALFGYGQISKDSMIKLLKILFNQNLNDNIFKNEHLVDALSLAYLGLQIGDLQK